MKCLQIKNKFKKKERRDIIKLFGKFQGFTP